MIYFFRELKYAIKNLIMDIYEDEPVDEIKRDFNALYRILIGHPWYCLKRGIKNLYTWFPVIWKTDVFDHGYLQNIMDKQLGDMEKFWKSGKTVSKSYHVAKRVAWTRKLLKMSMDEYYVMKHYDEWQERYPEGFEKEVCRWDKEGKPLASRTKRTDTYEAYIKGSAKAYEKDMKVYKLFIKNFSKHNEWWD